MEPGDRQETRGVSACGLFKGVLLKLRLATWRTPSGQNWHVFEQYRRGTPQSADRDSDWDYGKTRSLADASWERLLGSIQIAGSAPQRRIFYTALYHSLVLPRIASDVSGHYRSFGGGKTVATANGFNYYDDCSLWDTFRATHPLLSILDPVREAGRQGYPGSVSPDLPRLGQLYP
jgi:hypothetical protein